MTISKVFTLCFMEYG